MQFSLKTWADTPDYPKITADAVRKDPACIYPAVRKVEGRSKLSDLPYHTYALAPRVRNRLITPALHPKLEVHHQRNCNHFTQKPTDAQVLSMKKLVDEGGTPVSEAISASCTDEKLIRAIKNNHGTVQIPSPEKYPVGTALTLYNCTDDVQASIGYAPPKGYVRDNS